VGNFNHIWDVVNDNWDRMSGVEITLSMKDVFALLTYSANMFLVGDTWNDWTGSQMDEETIAETGYSPWVQNFNYGYDEDNTVWRRLESTPTGELKTEKTDIAVYEPDGTLATAVDDTAGGDVGDIVLASTSSLTLPNITVYIKNAGGGSADAIQNCYILVSPTGAASTWEALSAIGTCTGLASGNMCTYQLSSQSFSYVKAECICAAGDDTTVDAYITGNKN